MFSLATFISVDRDINRGGNISADLKSQAATQERSARIFRTRFGILTRGNGLLGKQMWGFGNRDEKLLAFHLQQVVSYSVYSAKQEIKHGNYVVCVCAKRK